MNRMPEPPAMPRDWTTDLDPLLIPRSIAILGASASESAYSSRVFRNLRRYGYPGAIYPVNPKYPTLWGLPCFPNIRAIPGPVECVIFTVANRQVPGALEECAEKGVKAGIIYASGFAESREPEGKALQEALTRVARAHEIRLCGPNCFGTITLTPAATVLASPSKAPDPGLLAPGGLAFVSQSGAQVIELFNHAPADRGLQFSYLISCGNEAVLEAADYLLYLLRRPEVRVIGGFVEAFRTPAKLREAAALARDLGKPLIFCKLGRSERAVRGALTHTAALAGSDRFYDAFFTQQGIVRVDDLDDLLDVAELCLWGRPPRHGRVFIFSTSGGRSLLGADLAELAGVTLSDLSPATADALEKVLPPFAAISNPLDATGVAAGDPTLFFDCLDIALRDEESDVLLANIAVPNEPGVPAEEERLRRVAAAAARSDKLIVGFDVYSRSYTPHALALRRDAPFPLLKGMKRALVALSRYLGYTAFMSEQPAAAGPAGPPQAPANSAQGVAPPPIGRTATAPAVITVPPDARARAEAILAASGTVLDEHASKQVLRAYGIPVTAERVATSAAAAVAAARELGFPVALKVLAPDLLHKSEAGAVRLHLQDEAAVARAYEACLASVRRSRPEIEIRGVLVQEMVQGVAEVIVGVTRDDQLGHGLLFGLGGVFAEVLGETSLRLTPLTSREAETMVRECRGAPILAGARGRPAADLAAVVDVLLRLSTLATELGDEIAQLDVNPLIVGACGRGAKAADALIIREGA